MGTPSSVGVDDDFTTCYAGVTLGTTDDETTRGLDVVDGTFVEEVLWDDFTNDFFHYFFTEGFSCDFLGVLGGNDDCVDSERDKMTRGVLTVFNGDLGF